MLLIAPPYLLKGCRMGKITSFHCFKGTKRSFHQTNAKKSFWVIVIYQAKNFTMAICKSPHWNLGIGIGIGTDTTNASSIRSMDPKISRVVT